MGSDHVFRSINPATEEELAVFVGTTESDVASALERSRDAFDGWRRKTAAERARVVGVAAGVLRTNAERLASLMTAEMGKPIAEARAEIEKCAWGCDYYAEHGPTLLETSVRASNATRSYVQFAPLGPVLAIMPWNFPFWQVFRFAAPALTAGNVGILKHASNVPQCARACEEVFREAGAPVGVFQNLMIRGSQASELIADPAVAAVTLTGSERAGRAVAEAAGRAIKKSVLELGGSDAFIVLADADVENAARTAVRSRYQNAGQSCIAAKRFIVVRDVFRAFRDRFVELVAGLEVGNPADADTDIGPLARDDLRQTLEKQLTKSVAAGADILLGGRRRPGQGYFFEPTVVAGVTSVMPLFREEVFGPAAALIEVADREAALKAANDSTYGLGASLWTSDVDAACEMAPRIEAGQVFINGMVASDPRLPFGGVKRSGYGRELSDFGIREFVNVQTVWIGPKQQ